MTAPGRAATYRMSRTDYRARRELGLGEWWVTLSTSARFEEWHRLSSDEKSIVTEFMKELNPEEER